jgi:DNA replication and repair protein RecF
VSRTSAFQSPGSRRAAARAAIRRLQLANFRSYRKLDLGISEAPVVLIGPNGAGKTNFLEAISFLAPGRGLRRATLEEVANAEGDGSWAVSAEVAGAFGPAQLGTGIDPPVEGAASTRRFRVDQEKAVSAAAFADHLRLVWLVPEMDGLFLGPAGDRRRFLDRLVLAIDAEHGTRVAALERSLRSRNRLLEDAAPDPRWLDAVEHEVAELAVAVAAARSECVARLRAEIAAAHDPDSLFPDAELALDGWMESSLQQSSAIEVEDRYRQILRETRERDRAAGRTLDGPHRTDLVVVHAEKRIAAARASTGERKALLVGLVLSHARLVAAMHDLQPVMLLDDVAAFLDAERRVALFSVLERLGAQVFMTGVDASAFAVIEDRAERLQVSAEGIRPLAAGARKGR